MRGLPALHSSYPTLLDPGPLRPAPPCSDSWEPCRKRKRPRERLVARKTCEGLLWKRRAHDQPRLRVATTASRITSRTEIAARIPSEQHEAVRLFDG